MEQDGTGQQRPWLDSAQQTWGFCGVGLRTESGLCAHVLVSPARHVPATAPYATPGVSPGVAVIMQWCVTQADRDGQRLLEKLSALCVQCRIPAIEVCAGPPPPTGLRPDGGWFAARGFRTVRRGVSGDIMRLDLHLTRTWGDRVRALRARMRGLAPGRVPAPDVSFRRTPPS